MLGIQPDSLSSAFEDQRYSRPGYAFLKAYPLGYVKVGEIMAWCAYHTHLLTTQSA